MFDIASENKDIT